MLSWFVPAYGLQMAFAIITNDLFTDYEQMCPYHEHINIYHVLSAFWPPYGLQMAFLIITNDIFNYYKWHF